jgi:putative NADH-flavin reductase
MQTDTKPGSSGAGHNQQSLKLVVLGATGGTGMKLVKQALGRGHLVTAFVRSPERLKDFLDHIKIRQGDLLSSTSLREVIQGHDAVLSGFGPRAPRSEADSHLLERFARALTAAMAAAGVRRVVVESVAFLFKNSIFPPAYLLGRLFFPRTVADASAMERIFANTALDWTMVRPPELTDKPYTGKYRVQEGHLPRFGLKISRADVADLMIKLAENGTSIRKVVGIAN